MNMQRIKDLIAKAKEKISPTKPERKVTIHIISNPK